MKQREEFTGPACRRCGSPVTEDMKLCACGYPTVFMSFEERSKFEVQQWREHQARQEATA